jgi:hypothetical protein
MRNGDTDVSDETWCRTWLEVIGLIGSRSGGRCWGCVTVSGGFFGIAWCVAVSRLNGCDASFSLTIFLAVAGLVV